MEVGAWAPAWSSAAVLALPAVGAVLAMTLRRGTAVFDKRGGGAPSEEVAKAWGTCGVCPGTTHLADGQVVVFLTRIQITWKELLLRPFATLDCFKHSSVGWDQMREAPVNNNYLRSRCVPSPSTQWCAETVTMWDDVGKMKVWAWGKDSPHKLAVQGMRALQIEGLIYHKVISRASVEELVQSGVREMDHDALREWYARVPAA